MKGYTDFTTTITRKDGMNNVLPGELHIGDRVRCGRGTGNPRADGECGTVIGFYNNNDPDSPLVEFDKFIRGHDGHGSCDGVGKDGYCWYVPLVSIEYVAEDEDSVLPDEISVTFDGII